MSITTKTIYFDEAGATGNHMLDPQQPFFVYASLGLEEEEEACDIHSEMRDRFRIQGPELKGNSPTKRPQGREAILWLWDKAGTRSKIAVAEKMFALAGKLSRAIGQPDLPQGEEGCPDSGIGRRLQRPLHEGGHGPGPERCPRGATGVDDSRPLGQPNHAGQVHRSPGCRSRGSRAVLPGKAQVI